MPLRPVPVFALAIPLALGPVSLRGAPPVISSLEPRGAERGRQVTLIVEGANLSAEAVLESRLPSVARLVTDDEALKPAPNRIAFRIHLNANEAPIPYTLRVRTREGLSNPVLFTVGTVREAVEVEPNETAAGARPVSLPVTVNGRLGPTDRDAFRFPAKKGERLAFEVEARRIGSSVDPTLHLLRADGRELALGEDGYGIDVDARIDHTFAEEGEYVIQVHDAMYAPRAPDFYRLKMGSFPYADSVFPLGGRAGSEVEVTLEGGNLPAPVAARVRLDADPIEAWAHVSLPGGGGVPFRLAVGTLPETFEEALAAAPGTDARMLIPSSTLNGRIEKPREADRYALDVNAGERWLYRIEAASLGSWLDPVLTLFGADGNRILNADDDGTDFDPRLEFTVPDGMRKLILQVEDLHRRGGKPFAYRLTASPLKADFELRLATAQANLPFRGTALVEVECTRRGYGGPVRLAMSPEPVGFTVRGGEILPDQTKGYLTITGPEAGDFRALAAAIIGVGGTAAEPFIRRARGAIHLASDQNQPVSPLSAGALECATSVPPPLAMTAAVDVVEVVLGHAASVQVNLTRAEGAAGEVVMKGLAAPGGITVAEAKVPPDKTAGSLAVTAAPDAPLREGDLILIGVMKVQGADFAAPAPALRVRAVRPFAAELTSLAPEVGAGSVVVLQGKVSRKPPFGGKVEGKVEGLPAGMTVSAVEVAPEKSDFQVQVMVPASVPPGKVSLSLVLSTPLGDPKKPTVHTLPPIPFALTVKPPEAKPAAGGKEVEVRAAPAGHGSPARSAAAIARA